MTAAELRAITEGLPKEAWPANVHYCNDEWDDGQDMLRTDHASLMFVGSMAAWLAKQLMASVGMPSLVINAPEDDDDRWRVYPSGLPAIGEGPTLLYALAAAVKAVDAREGGEQ